ncbi:conserved hypothetical protein [Xenorhabdus bovienii str. feltiae France]|nr:conserved hypothetical protein [Xenorhabdus bovienii str. feltiae France]
MNFVSGKKPATPINNLSTTPELPGFNSKGWLIELTSIPFTIKLSLSSLKTAPNRSQLDFIAMVLKPVAIFLIILFPEVIEEVRRARVEELLEAGKLSVPCKRFE